MEEACQKMATDIALLGIEWSLHRIHIQIRPTQNYLQPFNSARRILISGWVNRVEVSPRRGKAEMTVLYITARKTKLIQIASDVGRPKKK